MDVVDKFRQRSVGIIEFFGVLFALGSVVWQLVAPPLRFVPSSAFALLAILPGLIAFACHCISALPRFPSIASSTGSIRPSSSSICGETSASRASADHRRDRSVGALQLHARLRAERREHLAQNS
jgi:hypothetical protein